uniref:Uncharacterized protein n=1 Tax=Avena sativa TaxID=4498 RepID=A0ACD5YP32_AVESA
MWMPGPDGEEMEVLNFHTYIDTMFPSIFGPYRMGTVVDATRKAGDVKCTADSLVGVLMDAAGWSGMFPGIVVSATVSHVLTPAGSRHGMTTLMDAELRVLSPRVPIRRIKFVRQCRKEKHAGTWTVVDASVDGILGKDTATCRLLPSGCLIQEMTDGGCKVTWMVNMEHNEATVPEMYQPLFRSGQALGACRWLAHLQRQCEYLPILHSLRNAAADMTPNSKMNVFEVAQRMTMSFCETMCGPWRQPLRSVGKWTGNCGSGVERFEMVARVVTYSAGSGAPGDAVLSVTAPVWLPGVPPQQVFDYLCDASRRGEWDDLGNGAPIRQEGHFATAQLPGNTVSVLRTMANGKLILQEACADETCMVLAYATTDEQRMQHAMNNGGTASLSLVPSGLIILPDGASPVSAAADTSSSTAVGHTSNTGSIISFMYQTLLNGQAQNDPSLEAIDDVGNMLCRVIGKIKDAVHASSVFAA